MKRCLASIVVVTAMISGTASAALMEQWVLLIDHLEGETGWSPLPEAGYEGSSAWQASGADATRRVVWVVAGLGSAGNPVPVESQLFKVEFFVPTAGAGNRQDIESQINGNVPEDGAEADIKWWNVGAGDNHQVLQTAFDEAGTRGEWKAAGPGPRAPADETFYADPTGGNMWLKSGSWLVASWESVEAERAWSALRITQLTPEPASLMILAIGAALAARRRTPA